MLYLDVVDVHSGPKGPTIGGAGPVLDVALRMRRFPDGALWSEMQERGTLGPSHVDSMARRLILFHRDAAIAPAQGRFGSPASHEKVTRRLIDAIDARQASPAAASIDWPALRAWLQHQLRELAPLWEARRCEGRVRECHGDLHLANVLQWGGESTAFDGIEFDDELRWIDVLDDIAFLALDLTAHGRRDLAFRFLDAWLEASGDHDGLPALRFYMVRRALVRSQVAAIAAGQGLSPPSGNGIAYLALAQALAHGGDARLAITHGLPGSGKSFMSRGLVEAAGAIRVRSDVERKRLFRLTAMQPSRDRIPGGIYDATTTARTYARLHDVARVALGAGWPMIVDAAFLRRSERARFAALAGALGVPFSILECRADLPLLRRRLEQRQSAGGDASEADACVLERLRAADEPLIESESAVAIIVDAGLAPALSTLARHWTGAPGVR
jgi:aminoglycoside phosphotransferase family enzyme/predicted kinase